MPLMLFINEVMVRIWELLDLAPKVLKRLSSLVASVTNIISLPETCVVTASDFTPAAVSINFESFTVHLPLTVFPFNVSVNVPSSLKVMVKAPGLIPYRVRYSCIFFSSLLAAIFEPAFARILSDVNTIAGSVYDHVPITFSLVACFLLEKIYVRLDTASSPEPPSTLFSTSLMSCA